MIKRYVKYLVLLAIMALPSTAMAVTDGHADGDRPTTGTIKSDTHKPAANDVNDPANGETRAHDEKSQADPQKLMAHLRERADRKISRRVEALNRLATRINAMKNLSDDQKTAFQALVSQYLGDLNNLKAKIEADTDVATMKADVKSISESYRIFALVMPQIKIMDTAERVAVLTEETTTLAGKLQARIAAAGSKGKDVAALNASLAELQAKIADAKIQAQNAENAVINLDPNGYPGNKAELENARNLLKAAKEDMHAARDDAKKIVQALKELEGGSASTETTEPEHPAAG